MLNFDYLNDDLAFKQVFMHNEILEDLITSFLNYIGKNNNNRLITELIPNSYINPDHKKFRSYYGDLTATKDDVIISIEMYKNKFSQKDYNKSLGYLCRLYSRQEKSIKTTEYKKVISLNFIKGNFKRINNNIVNGYSLKNSINNEEINDNILMYLVRYDLIDNIPYKYEEERFITYLRIIGSKSVKDMKKYAKGDKIMEEIIKMLKEWNIESDRINYQRRIEEAKEEGIEENKISTAKKLIKLNAAKEYILEITEISDKEYEKLVNHK